jgi:hypothetical protein
MLATVWELPNGTLAMPRILSNLSDAPMLGEAAILWLLSIQPEKGFPVRTGSSVPPFVYSVLMGALLFGIWRMVAAIKVSSASLREPVPDVLVPKFQGFLWLALIVGTIGALSFGHTLPGFALLLTALLLPRTKKPGTGGIATQPDKSGTQQAGGGDA